MEKDLDPEVIKSTQTSLGKYVKRPPLSEKLLKKPPFRFLHDVITTVLKTTGFFENLFEEEELVSDNVKDRDSKIVFLQKVIYVIGATTGKQLSAKPSKIVAGQEPEKTNELLQCLAQALDEKLSSNVAVKQYKESVTSNQASDTKTKDASKVVKKGIDTKKLSSKSNEKLTSQKSDVTKSTIRQDKEKSNDLRSKRKDNSSTKSEIQPQKKAQPTKAAVKKNAKEQKDPKTDNVPTRSQKATSQNNVETQKSSIEVENSLSVQTKPNTQDLEVFKEKEGRSDDHDIHTDPSITKLTNESKINNSFSIGVNDLDSSASSNDLLETTHANTSEKISENYTKENLSPDDQLNTDDNGISQQNIQTDINVPNKPNKPNSAINKKELDYKTMRADRKDPFNAVKVPFNTDHDTKIPHPPSARPASVRPSSSRPGAPRTREKVDNVIKETDNLLMGKVNIIVENTHNEEEEDSSPIIIDQTEPVVASQHQQEHQLSSNEHGHLVQQILDSQKELTQISGKTEIEWQFGAQKAREAMNQDVEQLRFNIQALSRVANPLGKLLDHIQEDVEVMRQELQQWSNIYDDVNKEMLKEKNLNEDSLMPFHSKLKQLEVDIDEKHDKINDLKVMIHKNAIRIEKLLPSGNVQ